MTTIPIASILVEDRQRKDLGDLEADFASVREVGLIQPVVVEPVDIQKVNTLGGEMPKQHRLVAGGRRLAWLQKNGFTELHHGITCDPKRPGFVYASELTARQRDEAELYENIKRRNLDWKEECCGIARVHRRRWIESKADALAWSQRHTANLLGCSGGQYKVTYALQIADELQREPDGELSKLERYSDAVQMLIKRHEKEAMEEQLRRRRIAAERDEKPKLPVEVGAVDNGVAVIDTPPLDAKETIWLSNMLRHGDFSTIAELEYPPDVYPCAMVFDTFSDEWLEQTVRLMKGDSYLVCFGHILLELPKRFGLNLMPYNILWNLLGLKTDKLGWPFKNSINEIMLFAKGNPVSPCPSTTCVVTANYEENSYPPDTVLDFILRATTINGASILLPCGGPVESILRLGRRPITFEADEAKHLANMEAAKAYYQELYCDNVEFK